MRWVLVYFVGLFVVSQLLVGCNNPTKALNWITPDRLGLGKVEGTMNLTGKSNGWYEGEWGDGWGHGYEEGYSNEDIYMDGESEADMIWLEWDIPQWKEPTDYDRFLRERVRTLELERTLLLAERSLKEQDKIIKKKDLAINNTIKNIDNALRREGHEEMWPKKLTEQYGTGGG